MRSKAGRAAKEARRVARRETRERESHARERVCVCVCVCEGLVRVLIEGTRRGNERPDASEGEERATDRCL